MVNPAKAGEEPGFFLRRPEIVRFQEDGWQEPCESRGSRTVLRGTGGETPPVYPTRNNRSAEMRQPTDSVTTASHKNGATFFATQNFLVET
jgi:hypothetical protein